MALVQYPSEFPSEAIRIVVSSIRNNDVPYDVLASAAWNLTGYAMGQFIGPGVLLSLPCTVGESKAAESLSGQANYIAAACEAAGGDGNLEISGDFLASLLEAMTGPKMAGSAQMVTPFEWAMITVALANFALNLLRRRATEEVVSARQEEKQVGDGSINHVEKDSQVTTTTKSISNVAVIAPKKFPAKSALTKEVKGAFDFEKLKKLFELAGKYAPILWAAVQEIYDLLARQQLAAESAKESLAGAGDHCDEDACACLEAAKKNLIEALAHIIHLQCR